MPLRLSKDDLEEQVRYAEAQLRSADDDEWGTTRILWENRVASLRQQLASLLGPVNAEASVALIFHGAPVIGEREIKLDFATDVLSAYQKIVALALAAQTDEVEQRGPVRRSNRSRLYIRDLLRGSVGFLLEEEPSEQVPMLPTALKLAVQSSSSLLQSLGSVDLVDFESVVDTTQGRLLAAVHKFSVLLRSAEATAEIVDDDSRVNLDRNAVDLISSRLDGVRIEEDPSTIRGVLLGVLPASHQFEIQDAISNDTVKGSISDELAERYRATTDIRDLTLTVVRAQIVTVRTFRRGELVREQIVLEDVVREADEGSGLLIP